MISAGCLNRSDSLQPKIKITQTSWLTRVVQPLTSGFRVLDHGYYHHDHHVYDGDKWTLAIKCHAMKARATRFSPLVGLTWPNNLAPENALNLAQQQSLPIGSSCIQFQPIHSSYIIAQADPAFFTEHY